MMANKGSIRMMLVPHAGKVATRATSMWGIYGSVLLQAVTEVLPYLIDFTPPGPLRLTALALTVCAGIARLVRQEGLSDGK